MSSFSSPPQIIDLTLIDYIKAFDLQKKIVSDIIDGDIEHDVILILEHPAVFTLGKRGGRRNLVVSEEFLESRNIAVIQTERGGNITYHGPGQLVLYPIVNLELRKLGVSDFVSALEDVMIKTAADFGVTAVRYPKNHGVWVKESKTNGHIQDNTQFFDKNKNICCHAKLGSIGLSVKRGVSFHGLAFNVNLDLTPFSWINPCGMEGVSMTSIENEIKKSALCADMEQKLDIRKVKERMLYHFGRLQVAP